MKKKRTIIITVLVVIVVVIFAAVGLKSYIESNLEQLADEKIANIDLSNIEDGIYSGSYKVFPVAAEVKVTVSNHMITKIELVKHQNGQGSSAETIPDKVVEAQTLEIDIVTGATYSSKVILKAIENALDRAKQ